FVAAGVDADPEVGPFGRFLRSHGARAEVSVAAARGHHANFDVVDVLVERFQFRVHPFTSFRRSSCTFRSPPRRAGSTASGWRNDVVTFLSCSAYERLPAVAGGEAMPRSLMMGLMAAAAIAAAPL